MLAQKPVLVPDEALQATGFSRSTSPSVFLVTYCRVLQTVAQGEALVAVSPGTQGSRKLNTIFNNKTIPITMENTERDAKAQDSLPGRATMN